MSVIITIEDLQAYAEVDYIIKHMNSKYINKIPEKLLNFFDEMKDPNYIVKVNPYIPLQNQNLKKYTLELLALLHLKYWCEDERRKQELYNIMISNQQDLQEQIIQKHSIEAYFGNFGKDISNNDFSQPKVVQKYNQYTENNSDIQDFTDSIIEKTEEQLPVEEKNIVQNKGFFTKLKNKIICFFKHT